MTVRAKAVALARKAVSLVSAPFRLNDAASYRAAVGGNELPGPQVNASTALQLSVVFACVRLIAETISTLPLMVYRRKNGGGREVASDTQLYYLLHDSPNADQTATEFWETIVIRLALRGNAFVLKDYDGTGNLVALTPLSPNRMGTPYRVASGAVVYPYNHPTRGPVNYTDADVWHIRGFGGEDDSLLGMSVVKYGALSMGGAANAERAASKLYGNDMRPGFVTIIKEFLSKPQRAQMKEAIADGIGGSTEQGGRFRLLEGGPEFKQLALSPEDAQLLETRNFSVEDLCRWFNVPPAMIGHGTAVSNWGTGREQINLGFLQYVLRPYLKRLEQGIAKALIRPEERRRLYAEFSVEGLLRADSAGRAQYYSTMVGAGIMKPGECRDLENLPPDDSADILVMQSSMVPLSQLGTAPAPAEDAIDALKRALGIERKEHETQE